MARRTLADPKRRAIAARHRLTRPTRKASQLGKRARGTGLDDHSTYIPPEDWYEPGQSASQAGYRLIVQDPGPGYAHAVTADQVRRRLAQLPPQLIEPLEVVQLSRMTRKKKSFPCYGMHWGTTVYLYPIEEDLVEYLSRPPRPAEVTEARMFGARWVQGPGPLWSLTWTPEKLRDFYLNNILIHELGHLLDNRNANYRDRERFAEWFAIEYGYRAAQKPKSRKRRTRRR